MTEIFLTDEMLQDTKKKDEMTEISRRLSQLETHIINMIVPMQAISKVVESRFFVGLLQATNQPLSIDDRGLQKVLNEFQDLMTKFHKGTWAVDPDKVYDKLERIAKDIGLVEIGYRLLMNKLHELEKKIDEQKVFVTFSGVNLEPLKTDGFTKSQEDFLSSEIWDEEISIRLANLLHKQKLKTWRNVLEFGKTKIFKLENFGKKAFKELDEVFAKHKIKF